MFVCDLQTMFALRRQFANLFRVDEQLGTWKRCTMKFEGIGSGESRHTWVNDRRKRYRSNNSTKFSLEIFIARQGFVCRTWFKGHILYRLIYRLVRRLFPATLAKMMKSPRHTYRLMIVPRSRLRR